MFRTLAPLVRTALLALVLLLGATAPVLAAGQPRVELYVTSWCPYCKKAESFFKAKGIAFTQMDIEKDPLAALRYQRYGVRGVPLVVIGGKPIAGFSVQEYEKALRGE